MSKTTNRPRPEKTQLVIAQNYQCFKYFCEKMNWSPNDVRVRFVHNIHAMRGYNGNSCEIVVVCGGPPIPKGPRISISRRGLAYENAWKQYERQARAIEALFNEVRMLREAYGVEVRADKCS